MRSEPALSAPRTRPLLTPPVMTSTYQQHNSNTMPLLQSPSTCQHHIACKQTLIPQPHFLSTFLPHIACRRDYQVRLCTCLPNISHTRRSLNTFRSGTSNMWRLRLVNTCQLHSAYRSYSQMCLCTCLQGTLDRSYSQVCLCTCLPDTPCMVLHLCLEEFHLHGKSP